MDNRKRVVVLVSGEGTNLQAIIDAGINIVGVVSDKDCNALKKAEKHNIQTHTVTNIDSLKTREEYDRTLGDIVNTMNPDLVVLAGFMRILSGVFVNRFKNVINLHPALPGKIPGANAISDAYDKFKKGEIDKTGVMVHRVIEEVDAGEVINYVEVPISKSDNLESLQRKIKAVEKPLLVLSINQVLQNLTLNNNNDKKVISGKVRDRFQIGYNLISFYISDRLSSFDRHICDVKGKGRLLNLINKWWMNNTRHIIDNHLLDVSENYMICKNCEVIPLEIIVRGYITGNTKTSLWTNYNNGVRKYCGLDLPEGLIKNQKLSEPLITPTTKGEVDELISNEEILDRDILNREELEYINSIALKLYDYGSYILGKKGLILVDTKYEFGRDKNGKIILIDEIHTCDSSRIWKKETYKERFNNGMEPEKLDKDCIRDYVKNNKLDLTKKIIIPDNLKERVFNTYKEYLDILTQEAFKEVITETKPFLNSDDVDNNRVVESYYKNKHKNLVVILSGSSTDEWFVKKLRDELLKNKIYHHEHVCSAHKETSRVLDILNIYNNQNRNIIFITIAGRSNALSGVVSCNTHYPVIASPPLKDKQDYNVNIHSTLQMPSNTPTLTILDPKNTIQACNRIFNLSN